MQSAPRMQRTLAKPALVRGFGYWSGADVTLELRPAPVGRGVVFVAPDAQGRDIRIPALVAFQHETQRRTILKRGEARVEMVEHVLAALAGMQVDNCEIRCDAAEMPGCDGSSAAFVEAIREAGTVEQAAERKRLVVRRPVRVTDGKGWVSAEPHPDDGFEVRYELDYGPGPIGAQCCQLEVTPESFLAELAPARTFILKAEADALRSAGLGARVRPTDLLIFDDAGPIDNSLRFDNECARHKALDMVGDFALAGRQLVGRFAAHRGGHALNARLVRALLAEACRPMQHCSTATTELLGRIA